MKEIGKTVWATPKATSLRKACRRNASCSRMKPLASSTPTARMRNVKLTVFFANRDPVSYRVSVPAHRTLHLRFNDLKDPEPVPLDTDYASVFESDVPIVVQHTRLDRRPEIALLSTIAYAEG